MRASIAVLAGLALAAAAPRARADGNKPAMQRVVIDRVELEPSPVEGYDRLRVFVGALDLAAGGKVMDIFGDHGWRLKIAGAEKKIPYLAGFYDGAGADTALVIVVERTSDYGPDLKRIEDALDNELIAKLPPKTQVAVVSYGDEVTVGKLGAAKAAQAAIDGLAAETAPGAPKLTVAIDKALGLLKRAKTQPEGLPLRREILVISDGMNAEDDRAKITALGKKADKQGVRIDAIAYANLDAPGASKGPFLNLGELAKQSHGTFRWSQKADGIAARVANAALELDHQYVLTFLVEPDDVIGKKIAVTAQVSASQAIDSNDAKVPAAPTCSGAECPEGGYCAAGRCVEHAKPKGTSIVSWILAIAGIAAGAFALLLGVGFALTRLKKKPMPRPGVVPGAPPPPGATAAYPAGAPATGAFVPGGAPAPGAPAAAPAPAAPIVGPQLYMMTGPRTGERIKLRHGFLMGKQPGCDLMLDQDSFASSQHAQVLMDAAGNCTLVDMGSTNGTFVNGVRVSQYALSHGVAIRVGSTELRFLAQ